MIVSTIHGRFIESLTYGKSFQTRGLKEALPHYYLHIVVLRTRLQWRDEQAGGPMKSTLSAIHTRRCLASKDAVSPTLYLVEGDVQNRC